MTAVRGRPAPRCSPYVRRARTAPCDSQLSVDRFDRPDSHEPNDWNEPTDSADIDEPSDPRDAKDPTDPIDRAEPTDPMDSTDSVEPTDSSELREPTDQRDDMAAIVPRQPRRRAAGPARISSTGAGRARGGELMHPDEFPVDEQLVARLVAGRFPRWAGLPVRRLASGGTVNAMFRLGGELVVRLPLVPGGAADVERERRWLPRLAGLLPVPVPEVVGAGEPGEGYPWAWSVLRWLPGAPPEPGALADPAGLAADLAAFVTAMRAVTLPDAPPAHRGGPLAGLDTETRAAVEQLRGIPEEGVDCDAALAVWEEALRAPAWDGPPVWLHADLMPGNLLVGDGRLAAVIDFGCAGAGDPACDLFPAWNLLPPDARAAFRAALGTDDAAWTRGRGRTLSQALIALPYYRRTNPAMAGNARHVIRAVLAGE